MNPRPKSENAVYKLSHFYDDPRYEGFAGSLGERFPRLDGRMKLNWRMRRFARGWKPLKVTGRVREFNDNPGMNSCPVFSKRAVNALHDFLKPNGELLPLATPVGSYFAFNVTTIAEVLDSRKSDVNWLAGRKPFFAISIYHYVFAAKKLKNLSIFVIPQAPAEVFVTEAFVQRARQHGLNGFAFLKVWPLPKGIDLGDFHKKERQRQLPKGRSSPKAVKGNVVMILLNLAGAKAKAVERKRINRLLDGLDRLLVTGSPEVPIGNLEGHDFKAGRCRVVLSCPDADRLKKHLGPVIDRLSWPNGCAVRKLRKPFDELQDVWD